MCFKSVIKKLSAAFCRLSGGKTMTNYNQCSYRKRKRTGRELRSVKSTDRKRADEKQLSLYAIFRKTYTEFINGRIKELGLSPRKDAVVMNSFVLGSDKTFFDGLAKVEQYNFFSDCYKFFAERYGEENIIAAVVHNDETTPQRERKKN